jgi:hypothetical protein
VRTQKAYKGNKKNAHLQTFPQKNYKDVHFLLFRVEKPTPCPLPERRGGLMVERS